MSARPTRAARQTPAPSEDGVQAPPEAPKGVKLIQAEETLVRRKGKPHPSDVFGPDGPGVTPEPGPKQAATGRGVEKGPRAGVFRPELLAKIDSIDEVPEVRRNQFIRDVEVAVALAVNGKPPLCVTLIRCEDRYRETHAAYKAAPTRENAKALNSAFDNLRSKQKEFGLELEPRDDAVSLARSKSRPPQGKAAPAAPGKPRRGRPSLTAALG